MVRSFFLSFELRKVADWVYGPVDALFGAEDGSELEGAFKDMSRCKTLMAWSSSDWQKLLTELVVASALPFHAFC